MNIGNRHARSDLTDEQVIEILGRYRAGGITQRELAVDFGVSQNTIHAILNGRTHTHLTALALPGPQMPETNPWPTPASFQWKESTWEDRANCIGADPDLFFPERGESTKEAKAICAGCEVRFECLDAALTRGEKFGIFGGTSERERRKMRKLRRADRIA